MNLWLMNDQPVRFDMLYEKHVIFDTNILMETQMDVDHRNRRSININLKGPTDG